MAAGDLSPDQARYVDLVAQHTGLNRQVVVAWVGAESGWGVNKPSHNYLNVGPGETYPTTEQAAARAAALVNASDHYIGIRAAIPAGAGAQVQAIGSSPWGTSPATLTAVYGQVSGTPAVQTVGAPVVQTVGLLSDLGDALSTLATGGSAGGAIHTPLGDAAGNAIGSAVTDAFKGLVPVVLEAGVALVFTVAAFAFIAMGVNRLTGAQPKGVFDTVSGAVGTAAGAAKLAAL